MKKRPILRHIVSWLSKRAVEWQKIGLSLGVDSGTLNTLDYNRGLSDVNRLSEVFDTWERTYCSPHTFKHLISCLEFIDENDAAKTIKEKLKDPQVKAEYSTVPDYK